MGTGGQRRTCDRRRPDPDSGSDDEGRWSYTPTRRHAVDTGASRHTRETDEHISLTKGSGKTLGISTCVDIRARGIVLLSLLFTALPYVNTQIHLASRLLNQWFTQTLRKTHGNGRFI